MAETLELMLFGNPDVRLAGQPLARLRSVKSYALLYYLAMTRRVQARTVLAGLFWGDVDEYYARRNFNRTLSDLAQFVGNHLVIERQRVAFAHHQSHWLDVAILESAVTTLPTVQTVATLADAATLVEKALMRLTPAGHYQLHELPRQYAEEQISQPTKTALWDNHAIYYAGLLHQQKSHLFTSTFRQAWAMMEVELDNIRYAWQWLIEAAGAGRTALPLPDLLRQMVEPLTVYHLYHLLWLPGQSLFDQACQALEAAGWANSSETMGGHTNRRAALLWLQISAGQFQLEMGHYRASLALAEQLLPPCREVGLEDDLFRALLIYGHTQVRRGARAEAIPAFQEALALAQNLHIPRYRAEALIGLGMIARGESRYADAQEYYQQGLALCQAVGYRPWAARILANLGVNYSRQDAPRQAQPYFEEALKLAQEEGDQFTVMINNTNLGGVQRSLHNYQASVDYHQRSLHMASAMGEERWIATNLNGLANTYLEMAKPTAAESALREALHIGHRIDSNE